MCIRDRALLVEVTAHIRNRYQDFGFRRAGAMQAFMVERGCKPVTVDRRIAIQIPDALIESW